MCQHTALKLVVHAQNREINWGEKLIRHIKTNKLCDIQIQNYGAIEKLDHFIQNTKLFYKTWKY